MATRRRKTTTRRRKTTRRRRRNPASPAVRSSNPVRRRRSRRSNPGILSGSGLQDIAKRWGWRFAGKLAASFVIRKFGSPGNLTGGPAYQSPTAGSSLTIGQYIMASMTVRVIAHLGKRFFGAGAQQLIEGADDLLLTKLVWTEGISRSQWARGAFGNVNGRIAYTPGQMWVGQHGQWNAMQGLGSELVQASPLDGPLGSELVQASPLDGPMGHLLPPGVDPDVARIGRYQGSGYTNPYQAAMAGSNMGGYV